MAEQGDFEAALTILGELAADNPYEPQYAFRMGNCLLQLRRLEEAAAAFEHSFRLGYAQRAAAVTMGYCYAAQREPDVAAKWFLRGVTIDPGWVDQLRGDRLKRLLGPERYERVCGPELAPDAPREVGWRTDLDFMIDVLHRSHYDIHAVTPREAWAAAVERVRAAIPQLSDNAVALEFMKLTALAGDGHTCMWPQFAGAAGNERFAFHMLPVLIYPFQDGFYIRAADRSLGDMVGARVLKIGPLSIDAAFEAGHAFVGHENDMHRKLCGPSILGTVEILQMIGAAESSERVTLEVEAGGRALTRTVETLKWSNDLVGRQYEAPTWAHMNDGAKQPVPLWLRNADREYWFEYLEPENIIYFQYTQVREREGEPFAEFLDRLFALIEQKSPRALVIDLRRNDGGSSDLYPPLIRKLIQHPEINQRGKLFTLIGRSTYSAAMNLAVDLEFWTSTLFVGEPTGCSPNFIGENRLFTLPYSGLRVSVSDRYHQHGASNSTDKRTWIAPHIVAELTSDQFRDNVDPGLAAIRRYLDEAERARAADRPD